MGVGLGLGLEIIPSRLSSILKTVSGVVGLLKAEEEDSNKNSDAIRVRYKMR